ncbi:MAG: CBU_0585 family protein [Pseudomonadota bacterium]
MSKNPILRDYVSDLDKFLQEFDQQHPVLSQTQQREVTKYRRIYRLRDENAEKPTLPATKLWEGF